MRTTKKNLHSFSIRLKESRKGIYTQEQLANIIGVNIKTIKRLENFDKKDNPSPLALNLVFLAQALDVTPEYLLGRSNINDVSRFKPVHGVKSAPFTSARSKVCSLSLFAGKYPLGI